ncbi:MAG TPA: hypothetical protein VKG25_16025 [Bryobacteraceae bacterium]|nr:hypothetical protein [Bryobacteraceae bacterium]
MKRWFGFVLLFAVLLAPGASAGLFSKSNQGPKINYKKKYVTQKYNNNKRPDTAARFGVPKGKYAPKAAAARH